MTSISEEAIIAELAELQAELRYALSPDGNPAEAVWVFRRIEGLTHEQWQTLADRHQLRQWLTLPLDGDSFPHLKRFQATLEKLAHQTEHDPLTGLANRRAFDRVMDIEIERTKRAHTPLSLAIFDLDDFKRINDTYGHLAGDEVLVAFAERLRETTRRYDLAARFGGEEFALVMAGSGVVKAQRLLERLLEGFRAVPFRDPAGNGTFHVTCSAGLTCFKGSVDIDAAELVRLADGALYEAKGAGKDQVRVSRLPFADNVPNDTLVHAKEKQFLFGGK
ncbi:diguanylate cyclase [Pseudodesulfovibrio sp. F-1]|uniref:diguanylate cyclase n=1 Tax=Pseudodesulfovibrio alkaliphilus TaxID=2661613 RepID=A0A7K1KQN3_9BACT|nr:GGDEF domain-containing protein [Pseudodesulfovibrio alkaliphilus]MUM78202.1 diguanylate cyclase [Pseudodesulfovibrio alkaliphilus]